MQLDFPTNEQWVKWIGLLFSILGFAYRVVTIWTSDRTDYQQLRSKLGDFYPKSSNSFWIFIRSAIIHSFLLLPIVAWAVHITDAELSLIIMAPAIIASALLSVLEVHY